MNPRWSIALLLAVVAVPSVLSARWINDKEVFQGGTAGKVEFSHYRHLESLGNDCPTCHNGIFHIVVKKNPDFTMKDMENGKSCGSCHDGTKAFSVKDRCDECHQN